MMPGHRQADRRAGQHLCRQRSRAGRGLARVPRDGWYYLTVAEGGTGYDHAVTMARSRNLTGPYELHPDTFLMTSKDAPDAPLQRAGHGQMVETPDGEIYHTHLCSRPLPGVRRSPLGPRNGDPEMRLGR
jgi:beta-xylosidase